MNFTTSRTLIVPAALQAIANAVGHVLDPDVGGALTFLMGYSADGQSPATHYVANVPMTEQTAALIDDPNATPLYLALMQLAAARGRELTVSAMQVQALRNALLLLDPVDAGLRPVATEE